MIGWNANDYTEPEPPDVTLCQECEHFKVVSSPGPEEWPTAQCTKEVWSGAEPELSDCQFFAPQLAGYMSAEPEPYPFMFGLDWRSHYKSLWLGWWLVTWRVEHWRWHFRVKDLSVVFQPGL